jgi:hypothetical protein
MTHCLPVYAVCLGKHVKKQHIILYRNAVLFLLFVLLRL